MGGAASEIQVSTREANQPSCVGLKSESGIVYLLAGFGRGMEGGKRRMLKQCC